MYHNGQGLRMYTKIGTYASGLPRYRCNRSTSQLEGFHLHLNGWLPYLVRHCGYQWADVVIGEMEYRWTVKAAREAGLLDASVKHYDLHNDTLLVDYCTVLGLDPALVMGDIYKPITHRVPYIKQGFEYVMRSMGPTDSLASPRDLPVSTVSNNDYINAYAGTVGKRTHLTADDKTYLQGSAHLSAAEMKVGLYLRGCIMTEERAEKERASFIDVAACFEAMNTKASVLYIYEPTSTITKLIFHRYLLHLLCCLTRVTVRCLLAMTEM
jgi:hypothetical protein